MFSDLPSGKFEIVRFFNKLGHTWLFQEGTIKIAIFPFFQNFCKIFRIKRIRECRSTGPFIFDQCSLNALPMLFGLSRNYWCISLC
jgi:hypothetical protein